MAEYISLRRFGKLRGVALSAVQKAIRDGRVTAVKRDGDRIVGIDPVLATEQWNARTDPAQAARSGQVLGGSLGLDLGAIAEKQAEPEPAKPRDGEDPHGYYAARAKREEHQAALAELELLEQLGKLVSVDDLREVVGRRYRAMRDKILNIPDRVAAILAAEKDPARVHAALTAELKRVLHELSDDAGAEAAEGIAERVAA